MELVIVLRRVYKVSKWNKQILNAKSVEEIQKKKKSKFEC